jgi:hypothetical protein
VFEDFSTFVQERLSADRAIEAGPRERVRTATLLFARLFRRNAGLMRCLLGFGGENAAFATSYQKLNRDWYKRVATAIARERGADASSADLLPAAYALGGMIDDFLAQIYLRKVPALAHLAQDEEKIADLLTDMWCFGAYGRQTSE